MKLKNDQAGIERRLILITHYQKRITNNGALVRKISEEAKVTIRTAYRDIKKV
jgi:hypothetical protein